MIDGNTEKLCKSINALVREVYLLRQIIEKMEMNVITIEKIPDDPFLKKIEDCAGATDPPCHEE